MSFSGNAFPIGLNNCPLTHTVWEQTDDDAIITPGNQHAIATENLVAITTENNEILITEG